MTVQDNVADAVKSLIQVENEDVVAPTTSEW